MTVRHLVGGCLGLLIAFLVASKVVRESRRRR